MKVNVFFLIVGILSILFGFTHGWNGQTAVMPLVDGADLSQSVKTTIFYVWHIISAENIVFGIAFLVMAFNRNPSKVIFTAWIIAVIIFVRWGVIFGSTLLKNSGEVKNTLVDSIAILIFIGLIMLGIRKKAEIQK